MAKVRPNMEFRPELALLQGICVSNIRYNHLLSVTKMQAKINSTRTAISHCPTHYSIMKALVNFVVSSNQLFDLAENESFEKFCGTLISPFILPSRRTLTRAINDQYVSMHERFTGTSKAFPAKLVSLLMIGLHEN